MKKRLFTLFLLLSLLPISSRAITNGDFEAGNLGGWTVTLSAVGAPSVNVVAPGTAINSGGGLNTVHSGNYAAMLYSGVGNINNLDWARIEQVVTVPPGSTSLETWFAAVLNTEHYDSAMYNQDAYVMMEILDSSSNIIYSQKFSTYDNYSLLVSGGVTGWKNLPWQQITVPLAPYVGQALTVRYTAFGCTGGAHYCYGYLDDLRFVEPPTPTPTYTITPTMTETYTQTPTYTATPTFTASPTFTPTYTASPTYTATPTGTPTYTYTPTPSFTPTVTPTFTPSFTITPTNTPVPFVFDVKGPFPNPGTEDTHIVYYLSRDAVVTAQVYTVSGEKVRSAEMKGYGGFNEWYWDGRNNSWKDVASGVFIVRMEATDPIFGKKYPKWCKAVLVK